MMTKRKKFFAGLIVFIFLCFAGNWWLQYSTGVSLGLQLQRLWNGIWQGGNNCRLAQYATNSILPPFYLSSVVMSPLSTQQALLQLQIAELSLKRYRLYLPADLNNLALAKILFGDAHIMTLNYECESLRDLFEINQARVQINYLKKMLLAQEQNSANDFTRPAVSAPIGFPTQTANSNFSWEKMTAHGMPKQAFLAAKEVYICQGRWRGNNYPGQYVNGVCRLTYGGSIIEVKNFVILTHENNAGQWIQSTAASKMKAQPIYGGYENGAPMAICRVKVNELFQVGKVVSASICDVALANQEVTFQRYDVLYPSS